jgi:hypothetical protein
MGWFTAEPDVGGMVNELASRLDTNPLTKTISCCNICAKLQPLMDRVDDAEIHRVGEAMPKMWNPYEAETIRGEVGGRIGIPATEILLAIVRQYQNRGINQTRVLLAGQEAPGKRMRSLQLSPQATGTPCRPGQDEQCSGEHPNAMQALPRFLAHFTGQGGIEGSRENALPSWWEVEPNVGRVAKNVASRVDRLKAIGNGQVPLQAAVAWMLLTQMLEVSDG